MALAAGHLLARAVLVVVIVGGAVVEHGNDDGVVVLAVIVVRVQRNAKAVPLIAVTVDVANLLRFLGVPEGDAVATQASPVLNKENTKSIYRSKRASSLPAGNQKFDLHRPVLVIGRQRGPHGAPLAADTRRQTDVIRREDSV